MQKPIDLLIVDTKTELVNKLNKTGLPISIMSMILHEIVDIVDKQLNIQVEQQRKQYEEELNKEQKQEQAS